MFIFSPTFGSLEKHSAFSILLHQDYICTICLQGLNLFSFSCANNLYNLCFISVSVHSFSLRYVYRNQDKLLRTLSELIIFLKDNP